MYQPYRRRMAQNCLWTLVTPFSGYSLDNDILPWYLKGISVCNINLGLQGIKRATWYVEQHPHISPLLSLVFILKHLDSVLWLWGRPMLMEEVYSLISAAHVFQHCTMGQAMEIEESKVHKSKTWFHVQFWSKRAHSFFKWCKTVNIFEWIFGLINFFKYLWNYLQKNMKGWSGKHEILCAEQSDRAEKKRRK